MGDCGLTILQYMLMHHHNREEVSQTIQAYRAMFGAPMDEVIGHGYKGVHEKYMEYMDEEMLMKHGKKIIDWLKDNILSSVCPLRFELRFLNYKRTSGHHMEPDYREKPEVYILY